MRTICFDTESSGLPDFKDSWDIDYAKFPFIASIAWQVHEDGQLLYEQYNYIKPVGWEMSAGAGAVNGLTTEFLHDKGLDALSVYRHLLVDVGMCDRIVGHNIGFDTKMLKSNLMKLGVAKEKFCPQLDKEKRFCTMLKGMSVMQGSKWPKLVDLYFKLFGETFNAHDALADVKATHRVYLELIK